MSAESEPVYRLKLLALVLRARGLQDIAASVDSIRASLEGRAELHDLDLGSPTLATVRCARCQSLTEAPDYHVASQGRPVCDSCSSVIAPDLLAEAVLLREGHRP